MGGSLICQSCPTVGIGLINAKRYIPHDLLSLARRGANLGATCPLTFVELSQQMFSRIAFPPKMT
jgi:hypothetical protein